MSRPVIDWEAVEREYLGGFRSLRDIGGEYGCSEGAIRKRARINGWERNLSAKINAKAEALVRKEEVREEVRKKCAITEREQIQASAALIAEKVINQRADIQSARATVQKLWEAVSAGTDNSEAFAQVGEILRAPNAAGEDKLNDLYLAAISLPQQIKNAKLLADAIKILIELERKVLRIDDQRPVETDPLRDLLNALGGRVLGPVRDVPVEDEE